MIYKKKTSHLELLDLKSSLTLGEGWSPKKKTHRDKISAGITLKTNKHTLNNYTIKKIYKSE